MAMTYTGKGGKPYLSQAEADASYATPSGLTSTDPHTGITYMNDRERLLAQSEERQRRGW